MAIELSLNSPDAWLQHSSPCEVNLRHCDRHDTILKCPSHIGKGYSQCISVRDGLSIIILNYEFRDDFVREIQDFAPPLKLEIEFILEGSQAGQSQLIFTLGHHIRRIVNRYPGNQPIFKVELHLKLPILKVFMDGLLEQFPMPLQRLSRDFFEQLYAAQIQSVNPTIQQIYSLICQSAITPRMHHVLHQILNCPYQGLNRRLYLESKALELMTLRSQQIIEQLASFEGSPGDRSLLQTDDLVSIYRAKEILLSNLHTPPSLQELARQVSLNRRKLNENFQRVFQMTPYEYLQDYRLKQAQQMLGSSDMKVEEVIEAVGYKSRSNFAVAFRKKFGMNPKHYQQKSLSLLSEKCIEGSRESASGVQNL